MIQQPVLIKIKTKIKGSRDLKFDHSRKKLRIQLDLLIAKKFFFNLDVDSFYFKNLIERLS